MAPGPDNRSGEQGLIARFFAPLAAHPGALGLRDDAAVMTPPDGTDLVWTTDALVENVHFFGEDAPRDVARKALRTSLSDIAAKGARPCGFLLSIALPGTVRDPWLEQFAEGLKADIEGFGCPIFGGDTVRTPGPLMINVAMTGTLPRNTMVTRSGASPGDRVMVSGTIGDAALGLALRRGADFGLSPAHREHLLARYILPQPRNALADAVRLNASAAMDISDGLVGDLEQLCRASGVAAQIEAGLVPLSAAAQAALIAAPARIEAALAGGDDYEILCTVAPAKVASFVAAGQTAGVAVTDIGAITEGDHVTVVDQSGKALALKQTSFSHF